MKRTFEVFDTDHDIDGDHLFLDDDFEIMEEHNVMEAMIPTVEETREERDAPQVQEPEQQHQEDEGRRTIVPSKKWFFTFNLDHIQEDQRRPLYDSIHTKFKNLCKAYAIQREKGESGNLHLQGCVYLHKKTRPFCAIRKRCIFAGFEGAHWEKVKGTWEQAVAYCTKEETYDGERWLFNVQGILFFFFS